MTTTLLRTGAKAAAGTAGARSSIAVARVTMPVEQHLRHEEPQEVVASSCCAPRFGPCTLSV